MIWVLGIIPVGAKNLQLYLGHVVNEFARYAPGTDGYTVRDPHTGEERKR